MAVLAESRFGSRCPRNVPRLSPFCRFWKFSPIISKSFHFCQVSMNYIFYFGSVINFLNVCDYNFWSRELSGQILVQKSHMTLFFLYINRKTTHFSGVFVRTIIFYFWKIFPTIYEKQRNIDGRFLSPNFARQSRCVPLNGLRGHVALRKILLSCRGNNTALYSVKTTKLMKHFLGYGITLQVFKGSRQINIQMKASVLTFQKNTLVFNFANSFIP